MRQNQTEQVSKIKLDLLGDKEESRGLGLTSSGKSGELGGA